VKKLRDIALYALFVFIFPITALGQTSQGCLACHSDQALTMEKGGKIISLFIDPSKLERSVHASLRCIQCHKGFDPNEVPHAKIIKQVQCQTCHDATEYKKSIHAVARKSSAEKMKKAVAAACKDCHGTHEILPSGNALSSTSRVHVSETCGKCHGSEVSHFSQSAHGVGLVQGVEGAPTCIDCHGEHNVEPVSSKDSPMYKTHEAGVCLSCHLDNPDVRQRVGPSAGFIAAYKKSVHGMALEKGNQGAATCSDCHGAHDVRKGSDPKSLSTSSTFHRPVESVTVMLPKHTRKVFTERQLRRETWIHPYAQTAMASIRF